MRFWDEKEAKGLFQNVPFYNVPIEKSRIKHFTSIDLLHELPFYDELSINRISKTFQEYARSYKIEIIDSKDPLAQLKASKSSIKDLFKDLLDEIKGFKYQITVKFLLRKHNGDIEFSPVYFNSTTKAVINSEYDLDKSFQEILYSIGNWINEGPGWVLESIEAEYVNISVFTPLSGRSCIKLAVKLRKSMKGLINIKSSDKKCFLCCHIRHLNPLKIHPERIIKADKKWLVILIMKLFIFLPLKEIIVRLNRKIIFLLMCFVMKMN